MKREASLRRVHEKGFKQRVRMGGRRMRTKEEREGGGVIPLPNALTLPPPKPHFFSRSLPLRPLRRLKREQWGRE